MGALIIVLVAFFMLSVLQLASEGVEASSWENDLVIGSDSIIQLHRIAVDGDNIYVVYQDRNGTGDRLFLRWFDGSAWSEGLQVNPNGTESWFPDIAADRGVAHIIYVDNHEERRDEELMYVSFDGSDFSTPVMISDPRWGYCKASAVAVEGDEVHIAFQQSSEIYYRHYDGMDWNPIFHISEETRTAIQLTPDIAVLDGKVHVVWRDNYDGDYDIYYRSAQDGQWSRAFELTRDATNEDQWAPVVAAFGSKVYVAYEHFGDSPKRVIYMKVLDGSTWSTPVRISEGSTWEFHMNPRIAVEDGHVVLVYEMFNPGSDLEVFFRHFDGNEWLDEERMSDDEVGTGYYVTDVALLRGRVHVIWFNYTSSTRNLIYKSRDLSAQQPTANILEVARYWIGTSDVLLEWNASDDYSVRTVMFQYRHSIDKTDWTNWTHFSIAEDLWGSTVSGTKNFAILDGEGFYEFRAIAVDIGGNSDLALEDPEAEGAVDRTPPTGSIVINDGDNHTADAGVTLSLAYADGLTDLNGSSRASSYRLQISNDGSTWTEVEPAKGTVIWSLTSDEGDKIVHYRVTDAAGLISETYTDGITLDLSPPEGSIVVNGGDPWTTDRNVILTMTFEDPISGVAKIRFDHERFGGSKPWLDPVETKGLTLPEGDGVAEVFFQILNNAGLESEIYTTQIILDTTAPVGTITINDGDEATTDTTVLLSMTFWDAGVGASKTRYSNEEMVGDELWLDPQDGVLWNLEDADGERTVHYQVMDVAGHVSPVYTATIVLDREAPIGSITVPDDHTIVNRATVSLVLTSSDETSQVVGMRLTNEDISGNEPWKDPVGSVEWALYTGDGPKKVYYQVMDAAGLFSPVYTLSLILDTQSPTLDLTDPSDGEVDVPWDGNISVKFTEGMDIISVEAAFGIRYLENDIPRWLEGNITWNPTSTGLTFTPDRDLLMGAEYTIVISSDATDMAGNPLGTDIETTFTTLEEPDDDGRDEESPGFGVMAVAAALVCALIYAARRR